MFHSAARQLAHGVPQHFFTGAAGSSGMLPAPAPFPTHRPQYTKKEGKVKAI